MVCLSNLFHFDIANIHIAVLSALERRTVEVAEEENSGKSIALAAPSYRLTFLDWENSDGEYPSSPDPMENIQPEDLDMDHLPT